MVFDPRSIFGEKIKETPVPKRGAGGKFVSKKKKEEKIESTTKDGAYPALTFYGHDIRRFYQEGEWYFSLEDISKVPHQDAMNPTIRAGDPEKLAEAKEKYAKIIDGIEVAKPKDIVTFIPYFPGSMPGPITDWLITNSELPVPDTSKEKVVAEKTSAPINPSDVGR